MKNHQDSPPMRCIKCQAAMKRDHEAVPGVLVDVCLPCRGVWFDEGELSNILGLREDFLWEQVRKLVPSRFNCPKCGTETPLETAIIEGITIEYCMDCKGIWLDKGELTQLKKVFGVETKKTRRLAIPLPPIPKVSPMLIIFASLFLVAGVGILAHWYFNLR